MNPVKTVNILDIQKKIVIDNPLLLKIKKAVSRVVFSEGIKKKAEITICLVNDRKIKEINKKYLAKNAVTDVIAFNLSEPKGPEGIKADIVVSTERAVFNSGLFNTSPSYELLLYVVHGLLHILGYEDKNSKQRQIMQEKSNRVLDLLKIYPIPCNDAIKK